MREFFFWICAAFMMLGLLALIGISAAATWISDMADICIERLFEIAETFENWARK